MDAAGSAVEQRHAQLALERRQSPNHGRQGGIEGVRGRGEASLVHDAHENRHRKKLVHGRNYYSDLWNSLLPIEIFIPLNEVAILACGETPPGGDWRGHRGPGRTHTRG